jgi:tetratricopeptide (TPR) repeat protein
LTHDKLLNKVNPTNMSMNRIIVLFVLYSCFFSSCQSQEHESPNSDTKNPVQLSESWKCANPIAGNKIMILLDPHGEADSVLRKYAPLAKKYHYTLYASPKIYNGLAIPIVNTFIDSLLASLTSTKTNKEIILAGFSGGAKYALLYTANHRTISRVVACGAVTETNLNNTPSLLFCGEKDMNYASMRLFNNAHCYHVTWNGTHSWPDANTFSLAFDNEAAWTKANESITTSLQTQLQQELNLQQSYMEQYGSFSDSDWKRIVAHLSKDNTDLVTVRCKGVLSMTSYLYTDHFIKNGQLEQAFKFCQRYLEIDPKNGDAYYFKALIERKQGDTQNASKDFNTSKQLGWHETADKKKDSSLSF